MDTVTESRLAIAIAQEGGIGIIHKNMTARAQAAEVAKVKRFESGVVKDPITITQDMKVRDVLALTNQHKISGLPVMPVGQFGMWHDLQTMQPTETMSPWPKLNSSAPNKAYLTTS